MARALSRCWAERLRTDWMSSTRETVLRLGRALGLRADTDAALDAMGRTCSAGTFAMACEFADLSVRWPL